MSEPVLIARSLRKRYGRFDALAGVDLEVHRGDLYGLLGQNGAGKTTAIKILARLIRATGGSAMILGRDVEGTKPPELFAGVGFLVESPSFFPHLSGRVNLGFHARLLGLDREAAAVDAALAEVGLSDAGDRRVKEYSLGMVQRLGIAQAGLGDPELLILDEPTNGLDPGGISEVRDRLREMVTQRERTVVLSSHLLSEVEVACNRVGVLEGGRRVAEGDVESLLGPGEETRVRVDDVERAGRVLAEAGVEASTVGEELRLAGGDAVVARALAALHDAGVSVYEASRERRSLEDVYHDLVTGASTT